MRTAYLDVENVEPSGAQELAEADNAKVGPPYQEAVSIVFKLAK